MYRLLRGFAGVALLLLLVGAAPREVDEPAYLLVVTSNGQPVQVTMAVEGIRVGGAERAGYTRETPFVIESESPDFEVTFRRMEGAAAVTAILLRRRDGRWEMGGLTGVGAAMRFALTDSTGKVLVLD